MMNRRMFLKYTSAFSALGLAGASSSFLTGCGKVNQNNLAALAQVLGSAAATLATLQGNPALATKITQLTSQVVGDIQTWKQGDPTNDIIQVLGDLEVAISSITAIDPQTQALIELALGTIQAILALLPPATAAAVQARAVNVKKVSIVNPPKTASDFKARWNAIADTNPKLKSAHIN